MHNIMMRIRTHHSIYNTSDNQTYLCPPNSSVHFSVRVDPDPRSSFLVREMSRLLSGSTSCVRENLRLNIQDSWYSMEDLASGFNIFHSYHSPTVHSHIQQHGITLEDVSDLDFSNYPILLSLYQERYRDNYYVTNLNIDNLLSEEKTLNDYALYPIAVRHIDAAGNFYIERPPFKAYASFKPSRASSTGKHRPIELWIPWTLIVFKPSNPHNATVYFSHKSLESMDDVYITCPLPNAFQNGSICYSNSLNQMPIYSTTGSMDFKYIYSLIVNEYFSGGWNLDIYPINMCYHIGAIKTIDEKEFPLLASIKNPDYHFFSQIFEKDLLNKNLKRIRSISNSSNYYSLHGTEYSDYIVDVLSSLDLQQTMQLYEEIIASKAKYDGNHHTTFKKAIIDNGGASDTSIRDVFNDNSIKSYLEYTYPEINRNITTKLNVAISAKDYMTICQDSDQKMIMINNLINLYNNPQQQNNLHHYSIANGVDTYQGEDFDTVSFSQFQEEYIISQMNKKTNSSPAEVTL